MPRPYTTDLTDEQGAWVEPLLPPLRPRGRRRRANLRRVLDAIFYVSKNGCVWEDLPRDFPNPSTVYSYFLQLLPTATSYSYFLQLLRPLA